MTGTLLLLAALTAAPPTAADSLRWLRLERSGVTLEYTAADSAGAASAVAVLARARRTVETFFGAPYSAPFVVRLWPDRPSLTAEWRRAWHAPDFEAQCWMVASGVATTLDVLSPRVWRTDACEHDPADSGHVERLLAHELVHVYHGQRNPHPDFDGMDALGWLVEGLAAYASGQLAVEHAGRAQEAIAAGRAPARLEDVWSGRYRYAVAGSMVAFVDRQWGRPMVIRLLAETDPSHALATLGLSETDFIGRWRTWVTGGAR